MADAFGRTDQILMGGLSSDSMFMTWPELAAVGGGLGMLIQQINLEYSQPIRRIFEIGPGVVPINLPLFGTVPFSAAFCDGPEANEICALRTQPTYYIIGRPEGQLQAQQFVGPQALGQCFYRKYGSACGPNVISLTGKAGCSASDANAKRMAWFMNGVTVNRMNMGVSGQEMVIQSGWSAMFAGLNVEVEGAPLVC